MGHPGRFRFSLARVLNVRETELNVEKQKIAAANAKLRDARARLASAEEERDRRILELADARGANPFSVADCLAAEQAVDRACRTVASAEAYASVCERERNLALAAWSEVYKSVKALERLREIRLAEHTQERKAFESKTLDEVASSRARSAALLESGENPES